MAKLVMLEECNLCPGRFLRLTADNNVVSPEMPRRFCAKCGEALEPESEIQAENYNVETGQPHQVYVRLRCPKWTPPRIKFAFKKDNRKVICCGHDRVLMRRGGKAEDEWQSRDISDAK